jgi:hypothetical protein
MTLTPCEKYALAEIILCGNISYEEFRDINRFMKEVQEKTIIALDSKGELEKTQFKAY